MAGLWNQARAQETDGIGELDGICDEDGRLTRRLLMDSRASARARHRRVKLECCPADRKGFSPGDVKERCLVDSEVSLRNPLLRPLAYEFVGVPDFRIEMAKNKPNEVSDAQGVAHCPTTMIPKQAYVRQWMTRPVGYRIEVKADRRPKAHVIEA